MVKLYRNRYIRKYKEDFLFHIWSKESFLDQLGHNLLQKYKNKYIWTSSLKRRKASAMKSRVSKMIRYLLIRSVKKNAFFWSNLQNLVSKNSLTRKAYIKKKQLMKVRTLILKLIIKNRHSIFFKDLNKFSNNLFWFSWLKMSTPYFYKIIYLSYLLNWNRSLDFCKFRALNKQNVITMDFLDMKAIDPSQYIYKGNISYTDVFSSKKMKALSYNLFKDTLNKLL